MEYQYNKMIKKPVLIVKNSPNPESTCTFILEEDDIKRIIEEAEGSHPYSYLEPIGLKYRKEYVGEIGESPILEIRSVDYESFVWQTTATPKVLENNIIKLDIYQQRPMMGPFTLASPNILVRISIEDLKNKVLRTSVNNLKFDFGDGVFGEVYLKIPIVKKDPNPIKIVSSNLLYNPGSNGKTIYFKHKCTPLYDSEGGWVLFSFEYDTPRKTIQFVSNIIDITFINLDWDYFYEAIKVTQNLLNSYGINTKPLFGEQNREFFLDVVDLDCNFNVDEAHLICSDISRLVGNYLSINCGGIGLRVDTKYINELKRFSVEFVIRVRHKEYKQYGKL
jgi:hypothetical protein